MESEGLFKEEETFRGPGEFVRENVAFLTTRHWSESKSTLNLSDFDLEEFDEREFQLELENYFEELSNLDENDWSLENKDQQEVLGKSLNIIKMFRFLSINIRKTGSRKYNFTSEFLLSGWKGIANLGMTMRALPCAGTLPPGADSFARWAAYPSVSGSQPPICRTSVSISSGRG